MTKIVIASNNVGKLNEIAAILTPLDIEIVPQAVLGVPEAEEPHGTFVENALAKARNASRHAGLPALADDSGICVDALDGAPGVYSARYAHDPGLDVLDRDTQDRRNNEKLLRMMSDKTNRHAHYYCVMVLTRHADDPQPLICDGQWNGEIVTTPRGTGGFGYDPLFLVGGDRRTAAELGAAEKNRVSHRALALSELAARLRAPSRRRHRS